MTFEMEIAGQLPGLNEIIGTARASKFGSAKQKKICRSAIEWAIVACRPRPHFPGAISIAFHWYEPDLRRDPDNITAGQKFILDALVTTGTIKNDSRRFVKRISHFFCEPDKDNPRVRFVIHGGGT